MSKNLIWKLLRQHISLSQFLGYFLSSLVGMAILLLGSLFYRDVAPVLTAEDSFMKSDYLVVSKKIGTGQTISGRSLTFSKAEQEDLAAQGFVERVGAFIPANYKLEATMSLAGERILTSELSVESIPDDFVGVDPADWQYDSVAHLVPLIMPRSYITMYNFGFAQSRSLPKVSEGLASMITLDIIAKGNGRQEQYRGRVIGFSNRMSSIIVPQAFTQQTNALLAPNEPSEPTRLMIVTGNLAEHNINQYLEDHGYDIENDRLQAEKSVFFLRLLVTLVMAVGLVISILSFYMLMLSIYLLVQKNTEKLQNLLLIGYSVSQTARPYQWLTLLLNVAVLLVALVAVFILRHYYLPVVQTLFPDAPKASFLPTVLLGLGLLLLVTAINYTAIRRKISGLWRSHNDRS